MRLRYQILLIAAATLAVYYPTIFAPLNSVDDQDLYLYLLNTDTFSFRSIFLSGASGGFYRPFLLTSFLVDKYLWGLEESFMHLNNLLLHTGNAILVFSVARRSFRLADAGPSSALPLAAALFFAVHPVNTEAVNWISGRSDLLAAFCLLLSFRLILSRPSSPVFSLWSASCLLLAALSKETALFFIPAAIAVPFFLSPERGGLSGLRSTFKKSIPHICFFIAAGAVYLVLRRGGLAGGDEVAGKVAAQVSGDEGLGLFLSIKFLLKTLGFYAKKLCFPLPLNFGIIHVSDLYAIPGVLVCVAVAWLCTRRTLASFLFIAAMALALPALSLPLLNITWTPVAERYMYIPSAFFLMGVSLSLGKWPVFVERKRYFACAAAVLGCVFVYGTFTRNILWQDNLALFRDTLRKSPDFMPARNEIAIALTQQGKKREANEIMLPMKAQVGLKNYQRGLVNKAIIQATNGDYSAARATLNDALADPGKYEVLILQAMLEVNRMETVKGGKAASYFYKDDVNRLQRLYEITGDPFYQYRLGVVHLHEKDERAALAAFTMVVKTAPPNIYYRKPAENLVARLTSKTEGGAFRERVKRNE